MAKGQLVRNPSCRAQRRPVRKRKGTTACHDTALENSAWRPCHEVHRHRVQHFIGYHAALECRRQTVTPNDSSGMLGRLGADDLGLQGAQRG